MNSIEELIKAFSQYNIKEILAKPLSENDNNKQQIYLCGSYGRLVRFNLGEVYADNKGKKPNFKAKFPLCWLSKDGTWSDEAPGSQLILYPKYPEIRLSGFVAGCDTVPKESLRPIPKAERRFAGVSDGRVLFIAVSRNGKNYAYLADRSSSISDEFFERQDSFEVEGKLFSIPVLTGGGSNEELLLSELTRIFNLGKIKSKQLKSDMTICDCGDAPRCPGHTLEAELGVIPNGDAAPDFCGWEVKAKSISSKTTLLTPEPDGGVYKEKGLVSFLRTYGFPTKSGKIGFNGTHYLDERQGKTNQTLKIAGFDLSTSRITDVAGFVYLEDSEGKISASWSFAKLLEHWTKKHSSTAYVQTTKHKEGEDVFFSYGPTVHLCRSTSFPKFLSALVEKKVVYDPGPSMQRDGRKSKGRSQFRLSKAGPSCLSYLYESIEEKRIHTTGTSS